MNLFRAIVSLIQATLPLPTWSDKEAVAKWLDGVNPILAELIAEVFGQFEKTGSVAITLLDGDELVLMSQGRPMGFDEVGAEKLAAEAEAEMPGKFGDGQILAWLQKLLPIIIQILPFLLEPAPAPEPPVPPTPHA